MSLVEKKKGQTWDMNVENEKFEFYWVTEREYCIKELGVYSTCD